jgi:two-component system, sporulation sensor kinase E
VRHQVSGCLLVLSDDASSLWSTASEGIAIYQTAQAQAAQATLQSMEPDVLVLAGFLNWTDLIMAFRDHCPWGYVIALSNAGPDGFMADLVVDEGQLTGWIRFLTHLAKLNRRWAAVAHLQPSEEQLGTLQFLRYLQEGRLVLPTMMPFFLPQRPLQSMERLLSDLGCRLVLEEPIGMAAEQSAVAYLADLAPFQPSGQESAEVAVRLMGERLPVARLERDYGSDLSPGRLQNTAVIVSEMWTFRYSHQLQAYEREIICRELQCGAAQLQALLTAAPVGLLIIADNGEIQEVNAAAESLLRLPRDQIIGRSFVDLQEQLGISFSFDLPKEQTNDPQLLLAGGGGQMLLVNKADIASDCGCSIGRAISLQDITELHALRSQLRRQDELILSAEMAGSMAHEIRNPLTAIRGFVQLLALRLRRSEMRGELRFAEYILDEIDRANQIITNFLNLAKAKQDSWGEIDLVALLTKLGELAKTKALLEGVELTFDLPEELPHIPGNHNALQQVFLNLTNNAVQATPAGGRVEVRARADMRQISVQVIDTGVGIPAEILERIFEPFYSTKESGTGLGLSLCRQIVREHRGTIDVSSQVGEGSVFTVILPLPEPSSE